MPPLFRMRVEVGRDLLDNLKALPQHARSNLRIELRTNLAPYLEREAKALMPTLNPAPPLLPFEFGGVTSGISGLDPKNPSRRYYFALISANPSLTDGQHWVRTGDIDTGFEVQVSDKFIAGLIRVVNRHPKAKYVYGPWQVAGHRDTGWGSRAEEARQILRKSATVRIRTLWRKALGDAMKRRG